LVNQIDLMMKTLKMYVGIHGVIKINEIFMFACAIKLSLIIY